MEKARDDGQAFIELAEEDFMEVTPDPTCRSFTWGVPAIRIYIAGEKEEMDKAEGVRVF